MWPETIVLCLTIAGSAAGMIWYFDILEKRSLQKRVEWLEKANRELHEKLRDAYRLP